MSKVKCAIFSQEFIYEQPWFYNNDFSLRCDLCTENELLIENSFKTAKEIYSILFPIKVNCFFLDYYIYDDFNNEVLINKYKKIYEYEIVRNIKIVNKEDETLKEVVRYIFYPNNNFNIDEIIQNNIKGNNQVINIVSFNNECIYSIYDYRGCDIVFFEKDKYHEFYLKLSKYLLQYDLKLMNERFEKL